MVGEWATLNTLQNLGDSIPTLASDGLIVNLPLEQVAHENSLN
jgi:hypothetical protein